MQNMLAPIIVNRSADAAAVIPEWVQLAPKGEFPVRVGDKDYIQVLDDDAIAYLANSLSGAPAGKLIDYDHFSLDPDRSSEAAGWIKELQARPDGLWGRIEWTDRGADAVRNRRYLYLSPTWGIADCQQIAGNRIRPTRLKNAALTNAPNMIGIRPIVNRLPAQAQNAGTQPAQPTGGVPVMDYKVKLLELLGLPADAADDAIETAIAAKSSTAANEQAADDPEKKKEQEAVVNRLRARVQELESAQLETQVEKDLDQFKAVIGNREEAKKALMANRENALAVLKSLQPAATHDRAASRTPVAGATAGAEGPETIMNRQREAVASIRNRDRCSFDTAFQRAQSEQPELFRPQQ